MIYTIKQEPSNGKDVSFEICDETHPLGHVRYHKKSFEITFNGLDYTLTPEEHEESKKQNAYILSSDDEELGTIYEDFKVHNDLKFNQLLLGDIEYDLYAIHFSSRDMALSLFKADTQIGQLELERQIEHDHMVDFHIYMTDGDDHQLASLIMALYYWKNYVARPQEYQSYKSDEAREYAYSKYDPQFIQMVTK